MVIVQTLTTPRQCTPRPRRLFSHDSDVKGVDVSLLKLTSPSMSSSPRAQKLLALVDLINAAAKITIQEWEKEDAQDYIDIGVPSLALYNSRRTIMASCGAFSELLLDPAHLIFELSLGYFQSRALLIAAEHYIADILSTVPQEEGMAINALGARIGLDSSKLRTSISIPEWKGLMKFTY